MEPRIDLMANAIGAKIAKRSYDVSLAIEQSPLPKPTLAGAHHGLSDETWAQVCKHYDDDQIAALVSVIAMINAAARLNEMVRNQGGSYEPGMFAGMSS